jgi:hypothetical protein
VGGQDLFDLFGNSGAHAHATITFTENGRVSAMALAGAFDGGLNTVIRHAAAQRGVHGLADLCIRGMGVLVQHRFRRHNLPVLAESALQDLLIDPCLLQRVQLAVRGKAFECGDFTFDRRRRQDAGTPLRRG